MNLKDSNEDKEWTGCVFSFWCFSFLLDLILSLQEHSRWKFQFFLSNSYEITKQNKTISVSISS